MEEITIDVGGKTLRPKDIPGLFKEIGVRPMFGMFTMETFMDDKPVCCACLLGALATRASFFGESREEGSYWGLSELAGIPTELGLGLSDGWEKTHSSYASEDPDYAKGFDFGQQALAACLEADIKPIEL